MLEEFVPREIFDAYAGNSIWFLDKRIIDVCEYLRVKIGKPITINNWHNGGTYNNSGYRAPDQIIGARLSQHKRGCAADIKVKDLSPVEVAAFIKLHFAELNKLGLTTIEKDTPTWTHIDCRWVKSPYLLEVPFQ